MLELVADSWTFSAAKTAEGFGGARRDPPSWLPGVVTPDAGIEVNVATSQGSARAAIRDCAFALVAGRMKASAAAGEGVREGALDGSCGKGAGGSGGLAFAGVAEGHVVDVVAGTGATGVGAIAA